MPVSVLIDCDARQARLIADLLSTIGHSLLHASDVWQGLVTAHRVRPDLIIVDERLPQSIELLVLIRATRGLSKTPILMLGVDHPTRYDVSKLGVVGFVNKPFDADVFIQNVRSAAQFALGSLDRVPSPASSEERGLP